MKARHAFLTVMAGVAVVFAAEIFYTLREQDSVKAVRAMNGISDDEYWQIQGTYETQPTLRAAYQGPLADASDYFLEDKELGYRLRPNLRALPGRLRRGGSPVYEVHYSTGRFGWRQTVLSPRAPGDVLFFGDAYLFGHGIGDEDTIPSRFSFAMKGAAAAHNYGVPGWGVSQVLRLIELGGEKPEIELGRPTKAFFLLTPAQITAAATGPRYELRDGKAVLAGEVPEPSFVTRACEYSALCERFLDRRPGSLRADPALLAAELARAQELLHERYGIRLTVISWNPGDAALDAVEKELGGRGVDVVPVKNALPGFPSSSWTIPLDGHPNAHAAFSIGQYLADRLRG